jgi:L-fuconolactonase
LEKLDKKDFYPYLDIVFEAFGTDRLLFGSDWPVCLVAAEYEQVIGLVREYMTHVGFSTDQAKVLAETPHDFIVWMNNCIVFKKNYYLLLIF